MGMTNLCELLGKKEEKKESHVLVWILAIVGAVAAIAAIAYAVYRYLTPDYLESFEDEFDEAEEVPAADALAEDEEDIFEDEGEI